MDGLKIMAIGSLKYQLSLWLTVSLITAAAGIAGYTFFNTYQEAIEWQDATLKQVSKLFDAEHKPKPNTIIKTKSEKGMPEILVAIRDMHQTQALTLPFKDVSKQLNDGLYNLTLAENDYRVLISSSLERQQLLVLQKTSERDELAWEMARATLLPFIAVIPLLILIMNLILHSRLKPIQLAAKAVESSYRHNIKPISLEDLPTEITPFVSEINHLIGRLKSSIEEQEIFIANAAHELRSPLTALSLQAECIGDENLPVKELQRVKALRLGIARSRKLLEQLLTLARVQGSHIVEHQTANIEAVLKSVIEDLYPIVDEKNIDLGIEGDLNIDCPLDKLDLYTLFKNLLDNAIRYSPEDGVIDIQISQQSGQTQITVSDSGIGVTPEHHDKLLSPFYRVQDSQNTNIGSGLGLSIVNSIVEKQGGRISFGYTDEVQAKGFKIKVLLT
ncbi:hypothetical protein CXF82_16875 [Shewanella sp. GutDb-MelDb]|nr:hypothetical protein CXF82_16875 [Shewanella sp. GutDb-MelDb]